MDEDDNGKLKGLKRYFSINHGDQSVFFQFVIIINALVSSFRTLFEYLCYGSTAIIIFNFFPRPIIRYSNEAEIAN